MNDVNLEPTDIRVSVAMITYNHEAYITQAIDSVLMQQTDFTVELVVGEDCSTDRTRDIVRDIRERYPEQIRLLLPEHNRGASINSVEVLKACHGKYIAMCEGDDYWTDPLKLQKQVDFLDTHTECVICFHKARILDQDNNLLQIHKPQNFTRSITDLDYLLSETNFAPTCSVMLRNGLVKQYPEWFYKLSIGDWALLVLHAQFGKIGYLDEIMSVYRIHSGGVWSSKTSIANYHSLLDTRETVGLYLAPQHMRAIAGGISKISLGLSVAYANQGDTQKAKEYLVKSIRKYPLNIFRLCVHFLVIIGRLYIPKAYEIMKRIQAHRRDTV